MCASWVIPFVTLLTGRSVSIHKGLKILVLYDLSILERANKEFLCFEPTLFVGNLHRA